MWTFKLNSEWPICRKLKKTDYLILATCRQSAKPGCRKTKDLREAGNIFARGIFWEVAVGSAPSGQRKQIQSLQDEHPDVIERYLGANVTGEGRQVRETENT